MSERTKEDVGSICWGCDSQICYMDNVGNIECNWVNDNDKGGEK